MTAAQAMDQHIPLGRTGWTLWSDAALRGTGFEEHPDGDHQIVSHPVILPAVIVCPRCGARNHAAPPYDLAPYAPRHMEDGDSLPFVTEL